MLPTIPVIIFIIIATIAKLIIRLIVVEMSMPELDANGMTMVDELPSSKSSIVASGASSAVEYAARKSSTRSSLGIVKLTENWNISPAFGAPYLGVAKIVFTASARSALVEPCEAPAINTGFSTLPELTPNTTVTVAPYCAELGELTNVNVGAPTCAGLTTVVNLHLLAFVQFASNLTVHSPMIHVHEYTKCANPCCVHLLCLYVHLSSFRFCLLKFGPS